MTQYPRTSQFVSGGGVGKLVKLDHGPGHERC